MEFNKTFDCYDEADQHKDGSNPRYNLQELEWWLEPMSAYVTILGYN